MATPWLDWRKIPLGIDEHTLEVRAIEVTSSDIGDAPMLPGLLDQTAASQAIATVTADGAFDTRRCHDAIATRGAAANIPPRKNATPWTPDSAGALTRNEALRTSRRLGRTIWRRWSGYHRRSRAKAKMHRRSRAEAKMHRRSRAEAKMPCVKLLGQRLTARDSERQVAEPHVRVVVPNRYTALGTHVTETVA